MKTLSRRPAPGPLTALLVGVALVCAGIAPVQAHEGEARTGTSMARGFGSASLAVTVPAGSLSIAATRGYTTLDRVGNGNGRAIFRGDLPVIRVVDRRGTLTGWQAYVAVWPAATIDGSGARVRVDPGEPTGISSPLGGVHEGSSSWTSFGRDALLMEADAGCGAGTFEDDGTIEVAMPASYRSPATTLTITIDVSVY
jgi:hypothetical protein